MDLPKIIQGGMGIGVSGWKLANAVASSGQAGVVSGICLDEILVRKLQLGDPGGHIRRALSHFPVKETVKNILDKFFNEKPKNQNEPYIHLPFQTPEMDEDRENLIVAGSFAEMYLAKEGHKGLVGVNMLEKVQTDCLATLYGCMLAGVDFITMGAGIPREIPGILDRFSENEDAELKLTVDGAGNEDNFRMRFNPKRFKQLLPLKRPNFLAIIASNVLALTLVKKATGKINGFIIESPIAGGHNAPPRGTATFDEKGELVYGPKDYVDLKKIKELGLPFWLGGGYGVRGKINEALEEGAAGVQVGTPFMVCEESAITEELKLAIINSDRKVITDVWASPTGFPFKVLQLDGTLSEKSVFDARPRVCSMGYLRARYKKADGTIGYRCTAEPVKSYVAKGGTEAEALNAKCLCNALFANIGLGSVYKNGYHEDTLITAGESLKELDYIRPGIKAKEIIDYILG